MSVNRMVTVSRLPREADSARIVERCGDALADEERHGLAKQVAALLRGEEAVDDRADQAQGHGATMISAVEQNTPAQEEERASYQRHHEVR